MAWRDLSWKFPFGEVCASFRGMPEEEIAGGPEMIDFLFTVWTLDSGCENPLSVCGEKGERVAGFSGEAKGSFREPAARTLVWP